MDSPSSFPGVRLPGLFSSSAHSFATSIFFPHEDLSGRGPVGHDGDRWQALPEVFGLRGDHDDWFFEPHCDPELDMAVAAIASLVAQKNIGGRALDVFSRDAGEPVRLGHT